MLRSVLALAGAAGLGLALAGLAPSPEPVVQVPVTAPVTAPATHAKSDPRWVAAGAEACEPGTPLQVLLLQPEGQTGGRAELVFEIRPDGEVHDLAWEWLLPKGVLLLDGERTGVASAASLEAGAARSAAAAERGEPLTGTDDANAASPDTVLHAGAIRVDLPHDGLGRGVTLRVTGLVEGSNELGETWLEPVMEERTAMFGEPTSDAVAVSTRDTESSAPVTLFAVPSRHRAGR